MQMGFEARFAPMVEDGSKRQSFRAWRRRPFRVGDTLQLRKGPRTAPELIGTATVEEVLAFRVWLPYQEREGQLLLADEPTDLSMGDTQRYVQTFDQLEAIAQADGFDHVCMFFSYLERVALTEGQLVKWGDLTHAGA